tara:strand:- start:337 stop:687 length:351 start_codon:yes stop_codon:yes gene_type:complete
MAIPSGSGTEVLKMDPYTVTGTTDTVILNGAANHIYTIISITVCETAGAAETFDLFVDSDGGGTDYEILSDQALGANKTFIFNDRLVLSGADELNFKLASAGDVDILVSYIDQDWS